MRILAREELQQQLVQVEAAQQRRAAEQRQPAAPFGLDQRLELAARRPTTATAAGTPAAAPRISERGRLAPRATSATRPKLARERLDDQAGLPIRVRVQHERGLVVARSLRLARHRAWPVNTRSARAIASVVRPAALHAHPDLEDTPCRRTGAPCRGAPASRSPSSARRLRRAGSRAGSPCRRRRSRECAAARLRPRTGRSPTVVAYGSSSPSSRKIFSRMNSAARKRSSRSVSSSAGYSGGDSRQPRRDLAPAARRAACPAPPTPARSRRTRRSCRDLGHARQQLRLVASTRSILLTRQRSPARSAGSSASTARSASVMRAASTTQHDDVDIRERSRAPRGSAGR